MATELVKVSELPVKTTQFVDGDLGIVSEYNGGTYVSKSINLSKFFAVGSYNTGDLNAALQSGVYRLGNTNTNMPSTDGNFGQLIVNHGASSDTMSQIVMSYSGNKMWIRGASGIPGSPVWSAWAQIANADTSMFQSVGPTSGTILNYINSVIVYKARYFYASGAAVSGLPSGSGNWVCWFIPGSSNTAGVLYASEWNSASSIVYQQIIVNNVATPWQTSSGMNGLVLTGNLDLYRQTGTYRFATGGTLTNAPGGGSDFELTVSGNFQDGGYCSQIAVYNSGNQVWTRGCANGSWSAWSRVQQVFTGAYVTLSTFSMPLLNIGDFYAIVSAYAGTCTVTVSTSSSMIASCSRDPSKTGAYSGGQTFTIQQSEVVFFHRLS